MKQTQTTDYNKLLIYFLFSNAWFMFWNVFSFVGCTPSLCAFFSLLFNFLFVFIWTLERRVLFTRRLQLRSQPDGQILGIHPHQLGLAGHCELFLFFYLSTVQCYVKKWANKWRRPRSLDAAAVCLLLVRQLQSHCVYYVYLAFLCFYYHCSVAPLLYF